MEIGNPGPTFIQAQAANVQAQQNSQVSARVDATVSTAQRNTPEASLESSQQRLPGTGRVGSYIDTYA